MRAGRCGARCRSGEHDVRAPSGAYDPETAAPGRGTPPPPLAPGTMIDERPGSSFHNLRLLKSEGALNVYLAACQDGDVWIREAEAGTEAAERLAHEAEVLRGLDCPMFPRVLACFEREGRVYLATDTDPFPTQTLARALESEERSPPQLLALVAQVAAALARLHERGWVHLGARPTSLQPGRPLKILDFAYATRVGGRPRAAFYHAGYSPPELLTGDPVDPRAD